MDKDLNIKKISYLLTKEFYWWVVQSHLH
jgi:hypothetical protein